MMHTEEIDTTCETIEPLLAAYALGERDNESRSQIDAHLARCPQCDQTLAAYTRLADVLPVAAPAAVPAPDMRARVVAAVGAAARGEEWAAQPRMLAQTTRSWMGRLGWLLGALALLALLAWNVSLQQQLGSERAHNQSASAALATLLQSPDVMRHPLQSDKGATGELLLSADGQTGAIVVNNMPALPADRVYQLWLVADGQRISGGTFRVDADGRGALLVQPPKPWSAYQRLGVTTEPTGGSPGPTSPRVIGGTL